MSLLRNSRHPFGLKIVLLIVNEVGFIVSYLCCEFKHKFDTCKDFYDKQSFQGYINLVTVTRRGRRRKKLLDDLKDGRGYCQLKEEALDCNMWRNRFGRGFGPVI